MASIQFVNRGTAPQVGSGRRMLAKAASTSFAAPSMLGIRPWRWQISEGSAHLRADRTGPSTKPDPDGRLVVMSCGAALHHARTALAANGVRLDVTYFPDAGDPDLVAEIRLGDPVAPSTAGLRLFRAIAVRRNDGRPLGDAPVPPTILDPLRAAAEAQGAHLKFCRPRDAGQRALDAILFTDADTPRDWLAAGEALSAVLLTATADGLAAAPTSDLLDVPNSRELVRGRHPAMVLRVGVPASGKPLFNTHSHSHPRVR